MHVWCSQVAHARAASVEQGRPTKKARLNVNALSRWHEFAAEVEAAKRTVDVSTQGFAFEFVEGALVKALRTGQWLLLDEINMAPPPVRRVASRVSILAGSLPRHTEHLIHSIK